MEPFPFGKSEMAKIGWELHKINLKLEFPFLLYQSAFLLIMIFAMIGGLVLMRYRKIGVPILILGGIFQFQLSPLFIEYSRTSFKFLPSSAHILALMPVVLATCLVVIAIIAWIRKPLQKEKLEEIKKKLE
jgi:hypothetical protein